MAKESNVNKDRSSSDEEPERPTSSPKTAKAKENAASQHKPLEKRVSIYHPTDNATSNKAATAYDELLHELNKAFDAANAALEENERLVQEYSEFRDQQRTLRDELTLKLREIRSKYQAQKLLSRNLQARLDSLSSSDSETGKKSRRGHKEKSIKLPDPPRFRGDTSKDEIFFEDWLAEIKNKLEANADHYNTAKLRMAYFSTRVGGKAKRHLTARMRAQSTNPFTDSDQMAEVMLSAYGDHDPEATAERAFAKLYQGKMPFPEFWAEFQRLAADLDVTDRWLMTQLRQKLNDEMQESIINDNPKTLAKFAQKCLDVDINLRQLRDTRERIKGPRSIAARPVLSKLAPARLEDAATIARRDKNHALGTCFNCNKAGHTARDCPDRTQNNRQVHELGDDSTEDSEQGYDVDDLDEESEKELQAEN